MEVCVFSKCLCCVVSFKHWGSFIKLDTDIFIGKLFRHLHRKCGIHENELVRINVCILRELLCKFTYKENHKGKP